MSVSDTLPDDDAAAANDVNTKKKCMDSFFFNTAGGELLLLLTVNQSTRVVGLSVLRQDLKAYQWERGENVQMHWFAMQWFINRRKRVCNISISNTVFCHI